MAFKMTKMRTGIAISFVLAVFTISCSPRTNTVSIPEQKTPSFSINLKPELNESGEVEAILVNSIVEGNLNAGEERLKLQIPITYVRVEGIAERTKDMKVNDANGIVTFTFEDDAKAPGGFPYFRTWTATREIQFPISISYRSLVQPPNSIDGPAFGIRPASGGVSGAGSGFLLVPLNVDSKTNYIDWDLSSFDTNAIASTTFGDFSTQFNGVPSDTRNGWYMAGPVSHFPDDITKSHMKGFWLGDFPYDVTKEMRFVTKMHAYLSDFFSHDATGDDYRVFLRQLDTPPYGGATALGNSFMLSRGPAEEHEIGEEGPRFTFTHEMLHMWVGHMDESHGDSTWFIEGLTTYYEYTTPFRSGNESLENYANRLNTLTKRYYANPGRAMSADEIVHIGFDDSEGDIRHAPYWRGALYFADLDARIRHASNNTASLDDLMTKVFELRSNDWSLNIENWAIEANKYTHEDELKIVRDVHINGQLFLPALDSFGHCVNAVEHSDAEGLPPITWEISQHITGPECFSLIPPQTQPE